MALLSPPLVPWFGSTRRGWGRKGARLGLDLDGVWCLKGDSAETVVSEAGEGRVRLQGVPKVPPAATAERGWGRRPPGVFLSPWPKEPGLRQLLLPSLQSRRHMAGLGGACVCPCVMAVKGDDVLDVSGILLG